MSDNEDRDNFSTTVGYVATVVVILFLGAIIGCDIGKSPRYHHTSYHNEYGEPTCEICKELLERGRK